VEGPNYITPAGYRRLREEYETLYAGERPRLVETIGWAAGNGDRSENGDYIYGRKRLREIDRRISWLSKRMAAAKVVDPAAQVDRARVFFGARVTLAGDEGSEQIVTLVGEDEAEAEAGRISWNSPIGRAIRGAAPTAVADALEKGVSMKPPAASEEVAALAKKAFGKGG